MKVEIYHQLGHNYKWNLQSLADDGTGDGVILAPRYMKQDVIEELTQQIRESAIFDPQFFLPHIPRAYLSTYDFFPGACGEFNTDEYTGSSSLENARKCVAFQVRNRFRYVVIPARRVEGMPSGFIENQEKLFVDPFLKAIEEQGVTQDTALQVFLNNNMVKDEDFSADVLNWITGIEGIRGVYLIVEAERRPKQMKDEELLYHMLRFVHGLANNELDVILGYVNTEALLLSIAGPRIVTIGSYENLRMFRVDPFEEAVRRKRQGPVPRIYMSKLLQSIDHNYRGAVGRALRHVPNLFDENKYQALMFQPAYQWHFSKPELYKHHLLEFSGQLRSVSNLEGADRYRAVRRMLEDAYSLHCFLRDSGVVLDADSDGSHLPAWLTAANEFANEQGWR